MKKNDNLPEVEPVELKPILSMRPGLFIFLSAIVIVLLILFGLFLLPGLIGSTCYVTFESNVANVAIYDGGKYLGSTEGSVYEFDPGMHNLSFYIDGIDAGELQYNAKKHYFFTLFHRNVDTVDIEIKNTEAIEDKVIDVFTSSISSWSMVLDYSETYHFPPLYSEFAHNASALGFSDIEDAWLYGAMHVTSKTLYDDYINGLEILKNSNVKYNSKELETLNKQLDIIYNKNSNTLIAATKSNDAVTAVKNDSFFHYDATTIIMGEERKLVYPDLNTAPIEVSIDAFEISATPVSEYEFALFVNENPMWAKSNKDELITKGLVDENYLEGITLSTDIKAKKPIRNISWYAAKAYTEWLSSKEGTFYNLPQESEWTVAALSSKDKPYATSLLAIDKDNTSPSFMLGQLWEFTDTSYIPLARITSYGKALELSRMFEDEEIIVKGGSYVNNSSSINEHTVGVMNKSTCSEYAGFRVVRYE